VPAFEQPNGQTCGLWPLWPALFALDCSKVSWGGVDGRRWLRPGHSRSVSGRGIGQGKSEGKGFDRWWLSGVKLPGMPTMRTVHSDEKVKVAAVFEPGKSPRVVWFEVLGRERVQVQGITAVWYCSRGAAKIMNFELIGGGEKYSLEYNTLDLTWRVGFTVYD